MWGTPTNDGLNFHLAKKLMVQFIIKKYIYSKNILYIKTEVTTLIYVWFLKNGPKMDLIDLVDLFLESHVTFNL